jgi:hypothetical protein
MDWEGFIPTTRAWCVWEILCSITQDAVLEIILPPHFSNLLAAFPMLFAVSVLVCVQDATSFKETDRVAIFDAIQRSVGFVTANRIVSAALMSWISNSMLAALDRLPAELRASSTLREDTVSAFMAEKSFITDKDFLSRRLEKAYILLGELISTARHNGESSLVRTYLLKLATAQFEDLRYAESVVSISQALDGLGGDEIVDGGATVNMVRSTKLLYACCAAGQLDGALDLCLQLITSLKLQDAEEGMTRALRGALISKAVLLNALGRVQESKTVIALAKKRTKALVHPHRISLTMLHQSLFQWKCSCCSVCKAIGIIPTALYFCTNCPEEPFLGHRFLICWICQRKVGSGA